MRRTYIDNVFEYYREKDNEELFPIQDPFLPRLLVVDDEERIRNMYGRFFTRRGFDVITASTAMEARELMFKEAVDIVFLDINMAEVQGDVLFELIRDFHQDVKVVVTSVYPLEEQKERIKDADAYFDKSDGQDALLQLVTSLI